MRITYIHIHTHLLHTNNVNTNATNCVCTRARARAHVIYTCFSSTRWILGHITTAWFWLRVMTQWYHCYKTRSHTNACILYVMQFNACTLFWTFMWGKYIRLCNTTPRLWQVQNTQILSTNMLKAILLLYLLLNTFVIGTQEFRSISLWLLLE